VLTIAAVAVWIVVVPLVDTLTAVGRRMRPRGIGLAGLTDSFAPERRVAARAAGPR
jgi:hypothetical protein